MKIQRLWRRVQCKFGYHTLDLWRCGLWRGAVVLQHAQCQCGKHWQTDPEAKPFDYKQMIEWAKQNDKIISKFYDDTFFNATNSLR